MPGAMHTASGGQEKRSRSLAAAMVTKQAINSITFLGFIEESLCPELRRVDLVVMDNLAVHKVKGVEEAIRSVGAEAWYLPPLFASFPSDRTSLIESQECDPLPAPPTFRLVRTLGKVILSGN